MRSLAALCAVVLVGCVEGSLLGSRGVLTGGVRASGGTLRWSRAEGTRQEYLADRYECLKEAQEVRSSHAANQYGAVGRSGQATNAGLFIACMEARGYVRDEEGPFAPPPGSEMWAN